MRHVLSWSVLAAALALPAACVTINVYFPEAAAQKAAEQFVDKVIGPAAEQVQPPAEPPPGHSPGAMLLDLVVPSAHAQGADITIQTPQIQAIQARMPEAALARELELEYACIALVANWAAGCGDEAEISLPEIFANLEAATAAVPRVVTALLD